MLPFQNTGKTYPVGMFLDANFLDCVNYQRWEVMKYKYFITVLEYIFQVSAFHLSVYFSDNFLLLPKCLYFTFTNSPSI